MKALVTILGSVSQFVERFLTSEEVSIIAMVASTLFILSRIRLPFNFFPPIGWHHSFQELEYSSQDFYQSVISGLKKRAIPEIRTLRRVLKTEGGFFSSRRYYLKVARKEQVIYVCAAPFGTSYFFSVWLVRRVSLLWMIIFFIPIIGRSLCLIFWRGTFYRQDAEETFYSLVFTEVLDLIEEITELHGLEPLTAEEKKPVLNDIFQR